MFKKQGKPHRLSKPVIAGLVILALAAGYFTLPGAVTRYNLRDFDTFAGNQEVEYKDLTLVTNKEMDQKEEDGELQFHPVKDQEYPVLTVSDADPEKTLPAVEACEADADACPEFLAGQLDLEEISNQVTTEKIVVDGHEVYQLGYTSPGSGLQGWLSNGLSGTSWFIPTETGLYHIDFQTYGNDANDYQAAPLVASIPVNKVIEKEVDAVLEELAREYDSLTDHKYVPASLKSSWQSSRKSYLSSVRKRDHRQARKFLDDFSSAVQEIDDYFADLSVAIGNTSVTARASQTEKEELEDLKDKGVKLCAGGKFQEADELYSQLQKRNESIEAAYEKKLSDRKNQAAQTVKSSWLSDSESEEFASALKEISKTRSLEACEKGEQKLLALNQKAESRHQEEEGEKQRQAAQASAASSYAPGDYYCVDGTNVGNSNPHAKGRANACWGHGGFAVNH